MRLSGAMTLLWSVRPPTICSACSSVESDPRSHSQASARAGWPKSFRNGWTSSPSGTWAARDPAGRLKSFSGHARGPGRRVEHLLGGEHPHRRMREIPRVLRVERGRQRRELIDATVGDQADRPPDVVPVPDEVVGQGIQEFGRRRRVRLSEIIHRIHDAAAHQVIPDPVDRGPGEERVGRRDQPVGQLFASVRVHPRSRPVRHPAAWGS